MCGIFAVVAEEGGADAGQRVLAGLQRLEYRGYDSWGVAVAAGSELIIEKHVGKIGQVAGLGLPTSGLALGHTRWATHGGVTEINAHPHQSQDGSFVLVQNGVVDNMDHLKTQLKKQGYRFISQTDTEVIVHLIEAELAGKTKLARETKLSLPILAEALKQLTGRSTIAVLTTDGRILAYRSGSPLVVGRNATGELFLSSDVLSVAAEATEYYLVNNGELVEIAGGHLTVRRVDAPAHRQTINFKPIDVQANNLDKEGFAHFMLKEIWEQATVLHQVMNDKPALMKLVKQIKQARQVYVLGAGSAGYAAGQVAECLRQAGVAAIELKAYQAQSYLTMVQPADLCLALSQSGETADTLDIVAEFHARQVPIASLVNMNGSSLTAESDFPVMLNVGPEVGVASTKALTGMMAWGAMLAELVDGRSWADCQKQLFKLEKQITNWLKNPTVTQTLTTVTANLNRQDHVFVLGRGQLYYPALEFALKLKEISYIHAEGFSAGELKHGTLALIEQGTLVICLVANDDERTNMVNAAAEVRARGGYVIGVSPSQEAVFDTWISVPDSPLFTAVVQVLPAQLLTYQLAMLKGIDADKPRNLAKSVTVK